MESGASQRLMEAVRSAALPAIWTQGVKLARQDAVSQVQVAASELTLRVRAAGYAVAPTVTLYLAEPEWSCDCGGKMDPCAHVAAAVIALAQGGVGVAAPGEPATAKKASGARLEYRLSVRDRSLALARFVVHADKREQRVTSLASELARGVLPRGITPTHEDLGVDRMLASVKRDIVPAERLVDLFRLLSGVEQVTLAGAKVRISGEPVRPKAVVEDAPSGGFVLSLERDPAVKEVLAAGVARVGEVLRPLSETQTTGFFLERLPLSRTFERAQQADLVTNVLPELESRLDVEVRTKRLPNATHALKPRIALDLSHHGFTLSVLPTLVYGDPPVLRIDGDTAVTLRDGAPVRRRAEEQALLHDLRDSLNLVPGRRVDLDGNEAIRFANKLRAWQRRTGKQAETAGFEPRPLTARPELTGDSFDVVFETEPSEGGKSTTVRADAGSVFRAWKDGLDWVPLEGGGWAELPRDWLTRHGHRVIELLAARDGERKVPRALMPELARVCDELGLERPAAVDALAPLLEGFEGVKRAPLPKDLNATLRSYQEHGVDWLSFLRDAKLGGVLADDMGLGKTLQALCALRGRTLVVCPKSVVYNWAEEIARFRPQLRTAIYHGVRRDLDEDADITLTTYSVLRLDVDRLSQREFDCVVLDEAQAIKNAESQTARAAFRLKGSFRLALSGTPVENRLEELWSLMQFANPGLLGTKSDFQENSVTPIANGNNDAAARLRQKIRPFVLRRMKRDVLPDLPPRSEAVLHVELDETERAVYDAVRVATRVDLAEKLSQGGGVLAALEALLRLRQASCHSGLIPGQTAERSSKVERLLEALEEAVADGHKALVFSQWTSLLDRVEPHLRAADIAFTRLDGSTRDRGAVVSGFQSESGPPVMLVSLKAGGTGLNLTAADHVFLLDPWWNPAVEDQAADRAHRIGQDRPVMVYRMVAKDTVEERILALQSKKRSLADVALGDAAQATAITRDDLLALLE
jgi:superfamily II DNA or RNA helicase